jgi:hypothetical protein
MSRNGRVVEPEFVENAVAIEELDMTADDVERLGFKVCLDWACRPSVSQKDAHALTRRRRMITEQNEAKRRRREAEQAAEFARRIPRGIPAPAPNMSAVEVMLSVDAHEREPSVYQELLDEQFAAGRRS